MLSEKTKQHILQLQQSYPDKRSALIPALHLAQKERGYLPLSIQQEVADLFNLDLNEVHSIVTFYDMFFEKPVGKHLLHICQNVSCMLRGSDELIQKICQKLNVKPGEITEDGEFTVIPCECLAACDRAPMMIADSKVIGPIQITEIEKILIEVKKGPGHPSPMDDEECHHG